MQNVFKVHVDLLVIAALKKRVAPESCRIRGGIPGEHGGIR
jgi:hypothetical protein